MYIMLCYVNILNHKIVEMEIYDSDNQSRRYCIPNLFFKFYMRPELRATGMIIVRDFPLNFQN